MIVHADSPQGPREVASPADHAGAPSIRDEHYSLAPPPGALERRPRAGTLEDQAFLAIGPGAREWLTKAAAAGTVRLQRKIAEAVALAKLYGAEGPPDRLCVVRGDAIAVSCRRGRRTRC